LQAAFENANDGIKGCIVPMIANYKVARALLRVATFAGNQLYQAIATTYDNNRSAILTSEPGLTSATYEVHRQVSVAS
jgi:hypothetical protein